MNLILASFNFSDNAPYMIFGLGAFVMMYVYVRPKLRRQKDPFEKPFAQQRLSQQRSVERQMETLLVELSEMSRQMTAQLDTRSTKLELLIKEADEKIELLKTLSQREPQTAVHRFDMDVPEPERPPQKSRVPEPMLIDPQHTEIYRRIDAGERIDQVAAAMNRPSGEIQLILALRPRHDAAAPGA